MVRRRKINPQIAAAIIAGVFMLLAAIISIFPQLRPWATDRQEPDTKQVSQRKIKPKGEISSPQRTIEQVHFKDYELIHELKQGATTSFEGNYIVNSLCFSTDGNLLYSGTDGSIEIWDTRSWELSRMMKAKYITSVLCSPDGKSLITAVEGKGGIFKGKLEVYDTQTWEIKHTFDGNTHKMRDVAISPLGKYIAGSCGIISSREGIEAHGFAVVWDYNKNKVVWRREFEGLSVNSIVFSPDGGYLVTGDSESAKVWDVNTWHQVATLKRKRIPGLEVKDFVESAVFSPNGEILACGYQDGKVVLWETKTWKEKLTLAGHKKDHRVSSLAFSPNGRLLASGSFDKTAIIWNTEQVTLEAQVLHNKMVTSVAFSTDGKLLATGGYDRKIKIWNLKGGSTGY